MSNFLYIFFTIVLVLAYPIIQHKIKNSRWKQVSFYMYIPCALIYIGITIFIVVSSYHLETTVAALRDYSRAANLDIYGLPLKAKRPVSVSSPLSKTLEGCYKDVDGNIYPLCTPEAKNKFLEAVEKYPDFPFSYYSLACCYKAKGDVRWRNYATKGLEILDKTIMIKGHKPDHDEAREQLQKMLSE